MKKIEQKLISDFIDEKTGVYSVRDRLEFDNVNNGNNYYLWGNNIFSTAGNKFCINLHGYTTNTTLSRLRAFGIMYDFVVFKKQDKVYFKYMNSKAYELPLHNLIIVDTENKTIEDWSRGVKFNIEF